MVEQKSDWVRMKPEELKKKIIDLAKAGNPSEKIGLILRDEHAVPKAKLFGLKIGKVLKEAGIPSRTEKEQVEQKIESLKKHMVIHKHDYKSKKVLMKQAARLNRAS